MLPVVVTALRVSDVDAVKAFCFAARLVIMLVPAMVKVPLSTCGSVNVQLAGGRDVSTAYVSSTGDTSDREL